MEGRITPGGKNNPGKNNPGKNYPGKNNPGKNNPGKNYPMKNYPRLPRISWNYIMHSYMGVQIHFCTINIHYSNQQRLKLLTASFLAFYQTQGTTPPGYRAVARTIIGGGVYIHIFVFCPTDFQALKYRSVTDIVRPIRKIVRRTEETTGHSV
jgi:hypothetical protein